MITTTEIERNRKAWELVKRMMQVTDYPYIDTKTMYGTKLERCFFCGAYPVPNHYDDCLWLQARKLVDID